jgi:hypothetical protein
VVGRIANVLIAGEKQEKDGSLFHGGKTKGARDGIAVSFPMPIDITIQR